MSIVVKEARDADSRAVVDLWTEGFATGHPQGMSQPYSQLDFDDSAEVARIFVAREGDTIAGTVQLFDSDHEGINRAGEAEFARLAVARSHRRRGVGRALVEHVVAAARARGDLAMVLWSGPHQQEGHRLYESLGFARVPERDELGEDGRERLVFAKPLG